MAGWLQDLRYAARQLRKSLGFTISVVLTLALGIGATTAIFSLVEGVLLRPLPFHDPERLVLVGDHLGSGTGLAVTAREIATYSSATTAFASLGAYHGTTYELSGGETPQAIAAARLTASVFPTLGVQPLLGRVFTPEEEHAHAQLAVIASSLWIERFHSDPHVLGSTLYLDRAAYTVIGVMPRSFEFPLQAGHLDHAQLWVPMSLTPEELSDANTGDWRYQMVGRIRDGFAIRQAAEDTARVAQQVMREFPAHMAAIHIRGDVKPLREAVVADARPLIRTLFLAVAVVLLIACANVAGLLLVRAVRRQREYAVRLALGAQAGAMVRAAVLEGLLLSLTGGILGLGLAAITVKAAISALPETMPRVDAIGLDGWVVAFAMILSLGTGTLCSLAPAFAALRTNLTEGLKEGTRGGTGSTAHSWLRSALVIAEVTIALVLLTVAGAFLRSFQKMRAVDPGFQPDAVLAAGYQLPLTHYATLPAAEAFNRSVMDRLSGKAGVLAVGLTSSLPATGGWAGAAYTVEGVPDSTWHLQFADFAVIDGDYFRAMGIQLRAGRTFTSDDRADSVPVVIVNETMARHLWPGTTALGKRIHVGNPRKAYPWATVIGIVADTKVGALDEASTDQWYFPIEQPSILYGPNPSNALTNPVQGFITLRAALAPDQMQQTLRAAVAAIDPQLALDPVQPMTAVLSHIEDPRRFNTSLISAFALGALLLTLSGTYAVVAFSVSLRSHEIAIRMAVGAQRGAIARMVLLSGAKLAIAGCGFGILGVFAIARLVQSFLFGVTATDPLVLAVGAALMLGMALAASALPAIRAASADPVKTLRSI